MQRVTYIGIGASAGGLEALQNLLAVLPHRPHFVYIVIQHLSKSHKSLLSEILSKSTRIPVIEPEPNELLKSGHLYVIPPEFTIEARKNRIVAVKTPDALAVPHPSIDNIFATLAKAKGADTIGIILSGTGHDGTLGLSAIRAAGGITMAQIPSEAEYQGMPYGAISSNVVDQVLPISLIGSILRGMSSSDGEPNAEGLDAIRNLLHLNEQLDLSQYKEKTVWRRISKRMMLLHLEKMGEYVRYMVRHPKESRLLYQDLLIGVTRFFRESEAFDALRAQLKNRLEEEPERTELRVWVTACSTGEEAYSVGIMLLELQEALERNFDIRIFATDIDDIALKAARRGSYTIAALNDMPAYLLHRYFSLKDDQYEVSEALRNMVLFTHHDLLRDPPFLNMDLISCRNALIYFTPATQQEVFTIFYNALRKRGILFLGISESASQHVNYFETLDTQWKIYMKEQLVNPPKLPKRFFQTYTARHKTQESPVAVAEQRYSDIEEVMLRSMYAFFIPSSIVVDRQNEIVFTKGKIPYLEFSQGFASLNLFKNLHPDLHHEVRLLIQQSNLDNAPAVSKFVELTDVRERALFVRALAIPVWFKSDNRMTMIYFQELSSDEMIYEGGSLALPNESDLVASLQTQLSQTKVQLQALQDEYELLNENMQMMHEELQSSNEELQASNEELETSNEELQSTNEELGKSYLQVKTLQKQLTLLLNSTPEAVMGFDMQGRHTFVNRAAAELLGYSVEFLIGREGHSLWHHSRPDGTHYPVEACPIEQVRHTGKGVRGVESFWRHDGTRFEAEYVCSPVMENNTVVGNVLFFHDITEQERLKHAIEIEQERSRRYLDVAGVIMVVLDTGGTIVLLNRKGNQILGESADGAIGKNWFESYIAPENRTATRKIFDMLLQSSGESISSNTNTIVTRSGTERLIYWKNTVLCDDTGKITHIISAGNDITEMEELKARILESEQRYELTFEQANVGIAHVGLDGSWHEVNESLCEMLGYSKEELLELTFQDITHPDDLQKDLEYVQALLEGKIPHYQMEKRYVKKDGTLVWANLSVALVWNEKGEPLYFISVIHDLTRQYELMASLHEKEELMIAQSRLAAMGEMLSMIAHQWRQPLTTISMAANNLLADVELEEVSTERIETEAHDIIEQTQYLSRTIEDFRNFFKADKERERIRMDELLNEALRVVSKSFDANDVTCTVHSSSHTPIAVFSREMQQVLINILRNAKEALVEYRNEQREITVVIEEDLENVYLRICNNGGAIDPALHERIFEPYFSTKEEKNGTGLGLYMSKTIIEKHMKGSLQVKNIDGGVCFIITLPIHSEDEEPEHA